MIGNVCLNSVKNPKLDFRHYGSLCSQYRDCQYTMKRSQSSVSGNGFLSLGIWFLLCYFTFSEEYEMLWIQYLSWASDSFLECSNSGAVVNSFEDLLADNTRGKMPCFLPMNWCLVVIGPMYQNVSEELPVKLLGVPNSKEALMHFKNCYCELIWKGKLSTALGVNWWTLMILLKLK